MSQPQIRLRDETKTFAPANLRSAQDDPVYQKLVQFYLENKSAAHARDTPRAASLPTDSADSAAVAMHVTSTQRPAL